MGNFAAGEIATESFNLHLGFKEDELAQAKKQFFMARNICKLAALALPEWQKAPGGGKLLAREEILEQRSRRNILRQQKQQEEQREGPLLTADGGHFWVQHGPGSFRCTMCSARASEATKHKISMKPCSRDLGKLGVVLQQAAHTKHSLHWAVHHRSGLRILVCSRCDAYASMAPKKLLEFCEPRAAKPNWDRLSAGRYPTQKFGNNICFSRPVRVITADVAIDDDDHEEESYEAEKQNNAHKWEHEKVAPSSGQDEKQATAMVLQEAPRCAKIIAR